MAAESDLRPGVIVQERIGHRPAFPARREAHEPDARAGDHGVPYQNGDAFYFMNPTTFEQLPITRQVLGMKASFLQPGVRLPVETSGSGPSVWCFRRVWTSASPRRRSPCTNAKRAL
jgi:hypothetical protein